MHVVITVIFVYSMLGGKLSKNLSNLPSKAIGTFYISLICNALINLQMPSIRRT